MPTLEKTMLSNKAILGSVMVMILQLGCIGEEPLPEDLDIDGKADVDNGQNNGNDAQIFESFEPVVIENCGPPLDNTLSLPLLNAQVSSLAVDLDIEYSQQQVDYIRDLQIELIFGNTIYVLVSPGFAQGQSLRQRFIVEDAIGTAVPADGVVTLRVTDLACDECSDSQYSDPYDVMCGDPDNPFSPDGVLQSWSVMIATF